MQVVEQEVGYYGFLRDHILRQAKNQPKPTKLITLEGRKPKQMKQTIEIRCLNNQVKKHYPRGISLAEIYEDQNIRLDYPILGARVNNKIKELNYELYKPKIIEFFDHSNPDGQRIYYRGLSFLLIKAVKDLFPEALVRIEHPVSKGYYCELELPSMRLQPEHVKQIKERMQVLIDADLPFVKQEIVIEEAVELFRANNYHHKERLFGYCPDLYTTVYYLEDHVDYFYGYLPPSTGYIQLFELEPYYDGMLLRMPLHSAPNRLPQKTSQNKMFDIFQEYKKWGQVLGVESVGDINEQIHKKRAGELIKLGEALHEKKVVQIVEQMLAREPKPRIALIAGPSSSGKTTFAKRLAVQLRVAGFEPQPLSMDNYFVDRENTPRDENGEYDFEALSALNLKLLNNQVNQALAGKSIEPPAFDFTTGQSKPSGQTLQLGSNGILILEGIHGLNPHLLEEVDPAMQFKMYVSALTQVGIDSHNRIPTTDNRLIRRLVRDHRYRGYSATETLRRWPSVRRGEERNIYPYQEHCDVMFNSALIFEFSILKKYAVSVLKEVRERDPEYSEAQRLLKFLSYFFEIDSKDLPPTSILREFLYGSAFRY